jgi:hypothetical protein
MAWTKRKMFEEHRWETLPAKLEQAKVDEMEMVMAMEVRCGRLSVGRKAGVRAPRISASVPGKLTQVSTLARTIQHNIYTLFLIIRFVVLAPDRTTEENSLHQPSHAISLNYKPQHRIAFASNLRGGAQCGDPPAQSPVQRGFSRCATVPTVGI